VIVAAVLWALVSYFINQSPAAEGESPADDDETGPIVDPKPWLLVALPALLVASFDFLGVLTALVALVVGGQAIFGLRSPFQSFLIAIAVVAPTYIVFKYFLYARFPAGVLMMIMGTLIGTFAGIIPGLSSGMSVALFLPLTFTMSPLHGIIFLISIYVSVGYGGALTAILLNTPGSPQNAVTTLDGFELTKQGRAAEALGVSISASVYGGLLSYFAMLASIGVVATVALKFGPAEMFLIAIAGVTVLGAVGSGSVAKTMASGAFGLLIGTIGIVPTGEWRATFNQPYLAEGMPIIPILIGMFVFSELMLMAFREYVIDSTITVQRSLRDIFGGFRLPSWVMPSFFRSTVLGIIVGLLPAAGGTEASLAAN
jgi:putative tricarboxylic transport membrane protein